MKTEKDPVAAYKLYAKKRPREMNHSDAPFYLAVNNCTKQESSKPSLKTSAVGQRKLNSLTRKIAEKAGLRPNVKNHSCRKTMIQALTNNIVIFTITTEIHARSLVNFYRQFNKLTSVFYASVLLLIIHFVITLSK